MRPPWTATRFLHAKSWTHPNTLERHGQRPRPSMRSLEPRSTTLHPIIYTVYVLGAGAHSCGSLTTRGCHTLRILSFHIVRMCQLISQRVLSIDVLRHPRLSHLWYGHYTVFTHVYVYRLNSGFSHCVELVPILSTNLDDRKHRLMKHCAASIARQTLHH